MSGKANRKHRRNKEFCEAYKKTGQRELNKALKLERHQKKHPADILYSGTVKYTRKAPPDVFEKIFQKSLDK